MSLTPVWLTGFEHGVANCDSTGGGICYGVEGTPAIDATSKRTGNYGLHIYTTSDAACDIYSPTWTANTMQVGVIYFCFHSWPTSGGSGSNTPFVNMVHTAGNQLNFRLNTTNKKIYVAVGATSLQEGTIACSLDVWYRLDYRVNVSANPWVIDWQMAIGDAAGTAMTQATTAQAADTIYAVQLGNTVSRTIDMYFDNIIVSITSAEYPIGKTGIIGLSPASDGTHVSTTQMQDDAGTNITPSTANAYALVNSVPIGDATHYIKQVTTGAYYAELKLSTAQANIVAAMALLAFKSASSGVNKGACYLIDEDAVSTTLYGSVASPASYTGTTVNYKSVPMPVTAGGWDVAAVNAIQWHCGNSNDVTPNPYWLDLMLEVAYGPATSVGSNTRKTLMGVGV